MSIVSLCDTCHGAGFVGDPQGPKDLCPDCNGWGEKSDLFNALKAKLDDIEDKVNEVQAEQASQREDLTAALTQIWNKVKNL